MPLGIAQLKPTKMIWTFQNDAIRGKTIPHVDDTITKKVMANFDIYVLT